MFSRRFRSLLPLLVGTLTAGLTWDASSAMAALTGPDVSSYQHPVGVTLDWSGVTKSGAAFAFVKATEGTGYTNAYFAKDWAALGSNGMIRGAYHFARPSSTAGSAATQAQRFVAAAGTMQQPGDLPPVLDLEVSGGLSPSALVAWTHTYLSTVAALTQRTPILYTYPAFWASAMAGDRTFSSYPLWIARYSSQQPAPIGGWPSYAFWQYTDSGTVQGIPTKVDVSVFNGTLDELRGMALLPPPPVAGSSPSPSSPGSSGSPNPSQTPSATPTPTAPPQPRATATPTPSGHSTAVPVGAWAAADTPGGVRLTGWAVDPAAVRVPARVQVTLDGHLATVQPATVSRRDVAAAHPTWGGQHGFDVRLLGVSPGQHRICVTALAASGGASASLGCVTRTQMGDPKIGLSVTRTGSRVSVSGWAVDPQTASPVTIRVSVGTRLVATLRASLAQPVPTGTWAPWGTGHGYATTVRSRQKVNVCLTYVNTSYGADRRVCVTK